MENSGNSVPLDILQKVRRNTFNLNCLCSQMQLKILSLLVRDQKKKGFNSIKLLFRLSALNKATRTAIR
ncbi:hypothetical protein HK099_000311, partial [Clydaea vesicula]